MAAYVEDVRAGRQIKGVAPAKAARVISASERLPLSSHNGA